MNMPAQDGKKRMTDVANSEQLLRLIQTIPSPKRGINEFISEIG